MLVFYFVFTAKGQQVNTLYFIDNAPIRHNLNPSFQPMSGFYFSLPIIGNTQLGFGNNSFTVSSLALPKLDMVNSLKPTTLIHTDAQINLLGFGFRTKNSYWTFGATSKTTLRLGLPRDMFKLGLLGNVLNDADGNPQFYNNQYDFKSFSLNANSYIEAALGYSLQLNEKWAFGLKLKYLHGIGVVESKFNNFQITTGIDEWKMNFESVTQYSLPTLGSSSITDYLKPSGRGGAFDAGVTFRPTSNLTFGASVTDLGMIKWNNSPKNVKLTSDYESTQISGYSFTDLLNGSNTTDFAINLAKDILPTLDLDTTSLAFSTNLSPKINASAELGFVKNLFTVGVLSTTQFYNKELYQDITASLNVKPVDWFNLSLSYSMFNGRASNLGAGLGFRLGMFNLFATADYLPLNYAPLKTPYTVDFTSIPVLGTVLGTKTISKVPYKTDRLNVAIGFNIVFGNKIDADNDGISNRRDKCPDTPHGVIVDKKGCPLDTDGDKVPDYYDKCPDTPKEAYSTIDADGCPLDTDGDGVFDYLDKCPDTPYQAYKTVDKNGCPKDTDMDGVPDYLDKCPKTPADERSMVDSTGCTIKVIVPVVEQPKVVEAPAVEPVVLTTPAPVVDKDTDGDGIVDRLDRCPQLAGVASNDGCPEIKKEVRVVFQKAIQGIQFETAKYIIKPLSFVILDHVAKVLAENPNYMVEVQGHTDIEGKPETNLILSKNRANAVRDYLITKGIDAKRLTANGYGQNRPVAPNTTIEGKAKNRRVEFVVSFE
ncbi:MAG: DUF5723 family protein [Paludibacter sp.]